MYLYDVRNWQTCSSQLPLACVSHGDIVMYCEDIEDIYRGYIAQDFHFQWKRKTVPPFSGEVLFSKPFAG